MADATAIIDAMGLDEDDVEDAADSGEMSAAKKKRLKKKAAAERKKAEALESAIVPVEKKEPEPPPEPPKPKAISMATAGPGGGGGAVAERWKAIYDAAGSGDDAGLIKLLKHKTARVDFQQRFGDGDLTATPLTAAAHGGQIECIQALLNAKASLNLAASTGATPLSLACQQGHPNAAELLIIKGADVDKPKANGCTPLYMAALHNQTDCVRLLLGAGAKVNEAAKEYTAESRAAVEVKVGATPLWCASRDGRAECVKLLIAAGANVESKTECGSTPLIAAVQGSINGARQTVKQRCEVIRLLLSAAANLEVSYKGQTLMEIAKELKDPFIMEALRAPRPAAPTLKSVVSADDSDLVTFAQGASARRAERRKKTKALTNGLAEDLGAVSID